MRTPWIRRGVTAATLALLAGGVLGCGTEEPGDQGGGGAGTAPAETGEGGEGGEAGQAGDAPSEAPSPRMREVADAWQGSDAQEEWRAGYYPIDAPVQLPEGGFDGESDQRAYSRGGFTIGIPLPDGQTRDGRIRWENGESMPVTAMSAEETLGVVDTGAGQGPGPTLEVTAAEAGEMRLHTSRGPATVPAWHFTIDGYDTPLTIAAVEVPEPLNAPVDPIEGDPGPAQPLEGVVSVSGDGTSVTLRTGRGGCDGGTAVEVYETADSVVVAGLVTDEAEEGTICTSELVVEPVTVELDQPVGERALLDAFDGELLLAEQ